MIDLVAANLKVRPFRTLISVTGVALGVILVVLFTGLATGMTNEMAKRAANWKAEIVFARPGGMDLTSSSLNVNTGYASRIAEIEGVESTVPVGTYVTSSTKGRFGLQQLDGVEWEAFSSQNDISLIEGRAPEAVDEVVLDERQMKDDEIKVGETIDLFGAKPYRVVGVFSPPSGSRIKMSLSALQDALESPGKCTFILVKVKNGYDAKNVASKINEVFPGNTINLTEDMVIDAKERVPGLGTFLRVMVGLGAFVSTIFVMLSLYTTITERRKEIGILKSLGASKLFIIKAIEGEAILIGVIGVVLGLAASLLSSAVLTRIYDLTFEFTAGWISLAVSIAILGSIVGALYPAWRASSIDPVEVMANE